jgi:hypothetical protein
MTDKRFRLTAEVHRQIVSAVRSGGFVHVAAEAWGVPRRVFRRWLKRGQRPGAPEPYASFAAEVCSAHAQARLRAEIAAYEKDAKAWLQHGPGRQSANNPGWTSPAKPPTSVPPEQEMNPFTQPEVMRLFQRLLEALTAFPEARACAAGVLARPVKPRTSPRLPAA